MSTPLSSGSGSDLSVLDNTMISRDKGMEAGETQLDRLPRSDTVRFGRLDDEEANRKAVAGGISLPRTLTIERPRFEQKNKVIGDFRTLSMQLSQGGLADPTLKSKSGKKKLKEIADLEWHKISSTEALTRLGSSPHSGLDPEQAKRRLAKDGPNVFSKPPNRWLRKLFSYFFGGFGTILCIAGIACLVAWRIGEPPQASNLALGVILFIVVIISAVFNAWQDFTTSRVMESVRGMLPTDVHVLRNGSIQIIPAADIVRGDIVNIKMGAKVPADCRIIAIDSEMKFDRSSLTGESDAIVAAMELTDDNYLESRNVLMAGTKCVSGEGFAVVTATGDSTIFGRLAKLSSAPKTERTTLEKEVFVFVLTIIALAVGVIVVCIIIWAAYLRPKHPNFMSVSALIVNLASVLVAFVPEGLPVNVSLSLTIIAARMRKAKVLVKGLSIVETLGAVNVVCSDKTGTLTQNSMAVRNCAVHGFDEDDINEVKHHIKMQGPIGRAFEQLSWIAAVCNAAKFSESTEAESLEKREVIGDATDSACLRFAEDVVGVDESNESWETLHQLAFNSKNKFAARLLQSSDDKGITKALSSSSEYQPEKHLLLLVKGAPDVLMKRCTSTLDASGEAVALTNDRIAYLAARQSEWANRGQRVLLLARRIVDRSDFSDLSTPPSETQMIDSIQGLTVVGLIGIVDPPRPEIAGVVKIVRGAGSRFFMVTGDFEATAVAIARQCNIITSEKVLTYADINKGIKLPKYSFLDDNDSRPQRALSLTGADIQKLQPEEWEQVCNFDEIVFARTTPDQKLRIVKEFQQRDGVVAMTGDGVNDAPALKQAQCGIAMGGGSEVAIEAADLVLLDSFSSFVDALLYGRLCFDNLKKTIVYLLPAGSFSELWPVLLSFFFGLPQILSNIQMILICIFTDLFPSLSLVYEKPEADILLRKPRNTKKDRLANGQLILQAYAIGVVLTVTSCAMAFWWMERQGIPFSDMWLTYGNGVVQTTRPDYFNEVLNQANAIFFFNLVITQYFNLHALRTRRLSIFQQKPYSGPTKNLNLIPAIITSFILAIFFSYVPPIQKVFLTRGIHVEYFFIPFAWGLFILSADELRKLAVRRYPKSWIAKLAW